MKTNFQITIAEPCNQDWAKMEQRNGQNFCDACGKCVIDFSGYSNAEIISIIQNSKTEICGRLSETQLNQLNYQLLLTPTNSIWMKYLGVLAIGVGLFNTGAMASTIKNDIEINKSFVRLKVDEKKPLPVKAISGYVFDDNKKPLVGIRVVIQNTKLFALTDKSGKYSINLNDRFDRNNNSLMVESLRYNGVLRINYNQQAQSGFMLSKSEPMIMGKMIMVKEPKKSL